MAGIDQALKPGICNFIKSEGSLKKKTLLKVQQTRESYFANIPFMVKDILVHGQNVDQKNSWPMCQAKKILGQY